MPFCDVHDLRMYYELAGSGPRLLCVSGSSGDLRARPNIFDSPLADQFEILAYDQRGLGQTDQPPGPYSLADYAADAVGLLNAVGWEQCSAYGRSFGGMVAQELAIRYPDRFERVVMEATSSGGAGGRQYPVEELADLPPDERVRRFIALRDTRFDAAWQDAHPDELQAQVQDVIAEFASREPGQAEGSKLQLGARSRHDTYDRLPGVTVPVFVCGGRYDGIAPPENHEALARQIPNARLEFFEGGHFFARDDPSAYARIGAFLTGTLEAAPSA